MTKGLILSRDRRTWLSAMAGLAIGLQAPLLAAENLTEVQSTKTVVKQAKEQPLPLKQRAQITYDAYILGPGDGLLIELLDLPELSGQFSIGPDGTPTPAAPMPFMWRASPWRSCTASSRKVQHRA